MAIAEAKPLRRAITGGGWGGGGGGGGGGGMGGGGESEAQNICRVFDAGHTTRLKYVRIGPLLTLLLGTQCANLESDVNANLIVAKSSMRLVGRKLRGWCDGS